jgi:hypothetical protein
MASLPCTMDPSQPPSHSGLSCATFLLEVFLFVVGSCSFSSVINSRLGEVASWRLWPWRATCPHQRVTLEWVGGPSIRATSNHWPSFANWSKRVLFLPTEFIFLLFLYLQSYHSTYLIDQKMSMYLMLRLGVPLRRQLQQFHTRECTLSLPFYILLHFQTPSPSYV